MHADMEEKKKTKKNNSAQTSDETFQRKVLTGFQVNCYFEVDLSRPFPYNELPEEEHKAFRINKTYIFIRKKTRNSEFFLYRGIF